MAHPRAGGRRKPKVYFEEWDDPLISGIAWVSELIEIAGGEEVFPELRKQKAAKDRIVSPHDVIAAAPDVIVASLVRQEGRSGQDPATTRLGCDPGGTERPHRRDQIAADSAAWTCGTDRRPRRNPRSAGTWEMIELEAARFPKGRVTAFAARRRRQFPVRRLCWISS
jgi:hypothetical protein